MIVHGIDLRQLTQRDFDSFAAASTLLYNLAEPLYVENKDAWRVLIRARRYVTTLHTFAVKPPRTFNRDLLYPVKKDADGNRLCRWDQKPVGKRRSYCGKSCLKEVDIRCSAGMLRYHVKERDKGICAGCGLDTQKLKRIMDHAARSYYEIRHGIGSTNHTWFSGEFNKDSFLVRLGFNRHGSLWEADHVVEVINGGESTLENTQTLCVPCHKAKTKAMHGARARSRRVEGKTETAQIGIFVNA
jgi:5-methylcytosine-specific restriction protein A